jgi:ubiquinone/menaquinone biosynthesis C-methylase UbiE
MTSDTCRVYEQAAMREALGDTLRPGGFALTDRALAACALPAGASVLDVGCGLGATVHYLRTQGYRAVGVDLSWRLLQTGRQGNAAAPLVQAMGEQLPLPAAHFAAVLTECSLSVMGNVDAALAECYRLLAPGGYLLTSDIYARNPAGIARLRELPLTSCLSGARSQAEITAKVLAHGFQLTLWEDHTAQLRQQAAQSALAGLWQCTPVAGLDALDMQLIIAKAKPGYFLLVARKADA